MDPVVDGRLHPRVPSVKLLKCFIRKRSGFRSGFHEGGGGVEFLGEAGGGIWPGCVPERFERRLQCFDACGAAWFQKRKLCRNTLQECSDFRYISFR
jgi:hypothetical protein